MGLFLFIQYFYSDKIALASVGARIVSESEAPELHELVGRLCAIAGLPKPRIAIVRTDIPNAFATGRSQSSSVVAVTTGLLRRLDKSELEAVLAHELSHIKNRDVAVMTIASFLSTVAAVIVQNIFFLGDRRDRESGNLFAVWLVSLIVWIVSFILIRTLSRYREFSADRGSAIITGRPSALVSALMKISGTMARIPREDLRKVEGMERILHNSHGRHSEPPLNTIPPSRRELRRSSVLRGRFSDGLSRLYSWYHKAATAEV
jgi:Heat shock protein. Metallo peptidase. MEROPS family M48B